MKNSDLQDMGDLKRRNREGGFYFWSRETVKFFKGKDETGLISGHYFVYSIRMEYTDPKIFKVGFGCRSGRVQQVGPEFSSLASAKEWIDDHSNFYRDFCDGGFLRTSAGGSLLPAISLRRVFRGVSLRGLLAS